MTKPIVTQLLLVLDEVDYMGSAEITNILNIRNEAPDRIKVMGASTPSGKHEEFYKWCVNASRRFAPPQSDIDNFEFTGYAADSIKDGNGWTEIYAPSIVNDELLKFNADTDQTYLEDLKDELSEMRFVQEVLAEFGEEEMGVYQNKYIESAVAEGERINHIYTSEMEEVDFKKYLAKRRTGPRILAVDWDKFGASTNMLCLELDKEHKDEEGRITPKFKVMFREEIPRSEFTYTIAVNKIIELNEIYDFDWIPIDRGYGKYQLELFLNKRYGVAKQKEGVFSYENRGRVA